MIVSFIGAVFGALQFLALMMTLDIIVGGKEAHILPVFAVMLSSMLGRQACFTMRPCRRQKPDILWQQRKTPYRRPSEL